MKTRIEEKIFDIYSILKNHKAPNNSLYSDSGGQLLFLYEYSKFNQSSDALKYFQEHLESFVESFSNTLSNTFCSGMIGNFWLLEYFKNESIIDDMLLEHTTVMNDSFLEWGNEFIETKNYDFLHGLLGLIYGGFYCSTIDNQIIKFLADKMLIDARTRGDTMFFLDWMPNKKDAPLIYNEKVNFGLSHGLPAAMIIFSSLKDLSKSFENAAIGMAEFILKFKGNYKRESLFNTVLYDFEMNEFNSRLAWCYGDLGIAISLWQTGKNLNINKYKDEAINIMLHNCKRKDLQISQIYDAGICHGSSGVAHIFRRFYWETGIADFNLTANYWTKVTLDLSVHENGLAGYSTYMPNYEKSWMNNFGLLEGIAGIGLSLLSNLNQKSSNWDQCMLIS